MSLVPNPHDEPRPAETAAMPAEEGIDASDAEERLDEAPEEARNRTDGYAPADDAGTTSDRSD